MADRTEVVSNVPPRITPLHPVFRRHLALADEVEGARAWLGQSWPPRTFQAKATIKTGGDEPLRGFISTGWAGLSVDAGAGRSQLIDLLLPGDALGFGEAPLVGGRTLTALTGLQVLAAQNDPEDAATQAAVSKGAHAAQKAEVERYVRHLTRLSAYSPEERVCCLFLEIHGRLNSVGLASAGRLPMPLSQPVLANMIAVSPVHLNRTLRTLRLSGLVQLEGGQAMIGEAAIHDRYPHLARLS